ncbi:MAG: hypothetical protein IAB82_02965 [Bacteroidetes bacterium]|uniref:Sensor of ECF-type sigma factor n=1 Tax=Candidatus Cryptobacteroides faecavium TaxID=2840762 RepID=A0A9D9IF77_9BACT|nr:hypothetical protein [Candidatus Cryptobacteroides faecavium]
MNNLGKFILLIAVLSSTAAFSAGAQDRKDGQSWREKIMSEKIAFITNAVGLTPEEAQTFWPVYNQLWEERGEAQFAVMKAYKALAEAVDGNRTKEVPSLLDTYLSAIKAKDRLDNSCAEKYRKVLPDEKVAKLYVAEERFRRQQIHKLHHGGK